MTVLRSSSKSHSLDTWGERERERGRERERERGRERERKKEIEGGGGEEYFFKLLNCTCTYRSEGRREKNDKNTKKDNRERERGHTSSIYTHKATPISLQ